MSRIFVSPNQPALFPLMSSFSSISMEDYHLFYKKDRSLLTILLVVLHREVVQSILVMGFLLWLEREGYTSKNLVENIMSSLTPDLIDRVADEAVICLKLMVKKSNNFVLEGSHDISMLQCFLDRKCVHLDDFYRDRDLIFDEVTCIADELSTKAFHDILEKYTRCGEPLVLHTPQAVNGNVNGNGFHYVGLDKYNANGEDSHQRNLLIDRLYARGNSSCVIRELKEEIPQENRTIFLTFSKGYPISENEVRDYFTRYLINLYINF